MIFKFIQFIGLPLTVLSSLWLKLIRKMGYHQSTDRVFMKIGLLPVLDHYYQPMINPRKYLTKHLSEDRTLPGIDLNIEQQLNLLEQFNYNEELLKIPVGKTEGHAYYFENGSYGPGDAEYLYQVIRHFKPKRLIEIGSGNSTLIARLAIEQNQKEQPDYQCAHSCIEPYEQPWLEELGVQVIRERVESIPLTFFQQLEPNDILFIDSSHIIRPQGDVLFEYLELLPTLNSGVLIHIHDIFTPKDYPENWVIKEHRLWNEQYLLEAFLTLNTRFKIIAAVNYLAHHHRDKFSAKCPVFGSQSGREPGAFWLLKT